MPGRLLFPSPTFVYATLTIIDAGPVRSTTHEVGPTVALLSFAALVGWGGGWLRGEPGPMAHQRFPHGD